MLTKIEQEKFVYSAVPLARLLEISDHAPGLKRTLIKQIYQIFDKIKPNKEGVKSLGNSCCYNPSGVISVCGHSLVMEPLDLPEIEEPAAKTGAPARIPRTSPAKPRKMTKHAFIKKMFGFDSRYHKSNDLSIKAQLAPLGFIMKFQNGFIAQQTTAFTHLCTLMALPDKTLLELPKSIVQAKICNVLGFISNYQHLTFMDDASIATVKQYVDSRTMPEEKIFRHLDYCYRFDWRMPSNLRFTYQSGKYKNQGSFATIDFPANIDILRKNIKVYQQHLSTQYEELGDSAKDALVTLQHFNSREDRDSFFAMCGKACEKDAS